MEDFIRLTINGKPLDYTRGEVEKLIERANGGKSTFEVLNSINVNDHKETKNGLSYLSWAWAWAEVKKHYPQAFYTIYENANGMNYHTDGRTCWVKTGVTIEGLEHIEYLPVMDYRNASIPADNVTSFDVNKAIQRSLTKAAARHGLGLYIYAGEDLPEADREKTDAEFELVLNDIKAAKTTEELKSLYYALNAKYGNNQKIVSAVNKRKSELLKNAA